MKFVFRWQWFVVSFAIGFALVYLWTPPPEVAVRWPHPLAPSRVFEDPHGDSCLRFEAQETQCEGSEEDLPY